MNKRLAGMLLALGLAVGSPGHAELSVTFSLFAPPPLPVYVQPPMPAPGYLWTPGYWGWDPVAGSYYWVPGTWVRPPRAGLLWTPGYWGWSDGRYRWYAGYWATRVGFYGGIHYGYGYVGSGYHGGRWDGGVLRYNTAANNIDTRVVKNVHVYHTRIANIDRSTTRVSYNGGNGGIDRRPTREEEDVGADRRLAATKSQLEHDAEARRLPAQRASVNKGRPAVAATAAPKDLQGPGAIQATNAETVTPPQRGRDAAARNNGRADPAPTDARSPDTRPNAEAQPGQSPDSPAHGAEAPAVDRQRPAADSRQRQAVPASSEAPARADSRRADADRDRGQGPDRVKGRDGDREERPPGPDREERPGADRAPKSGAPGNSGRPRKGPDSP